MAEEEVHSAVEEAVVEGLKPQVVAVEVEGDRGIAKPRHHPAVGEANSLLVEGVDCYHP